MNKLSEGLLTFSVIDEQIREKRLASGNIITSQIGLDDAQEEQEQNKLASKRAMTVNMLAPRKRRNVACNLGFHVTSAS